MKNEDNPLIKTGERSTNRRKRRFNLLMIGLGFLCSIITGFFLWQVSDIPFGLLFHLVMYLFVGSLFILLVSCSVFFFRSKQIWSRLVGVVLILISIVVIMLTAILNTDYRILYFHSFSPKPTKTEWVEDLHYLRDQMIEKHCDLDALISIEELNDTVKAIEKRLPRLSDSERRLPRWSRPIP